jgi:hypothetical protein
VALAWVGSNEEVKKTVEDWLIVMAAGFYNAGIQKLITGYDRHLTLRGNYVEKLFKVFIDIKYF